ncbi:hypothetical protein AU894_26545 [Salmonella enterica subsp. enterica]|uniref:Fimbrial protein n=1 Tax=Salmonella enterica subsp. enterica serovar Java TaxID=224729 RepID=A0A3Y9C6S8_SALEB|nr:hypothetical protein [Salmonella enterica subsp. enterica serovar Java]
MRKYLLCCAAVLMPLLPGTTVYADSGFSAPTLMHLGVDLKSDVPSPRLQWIPSTTLKSNDFNGTSPVRMGQLNVTLTGSVVANGTRVVALGPDCAGGGEKVLTFHTDTLGEAFGVPKDTDIPAILNVSGSSGTSIFIEEPDESMPGFWVFHRENATTEAEGEAMVMFNVMSSTGSKNPGGVPGHYDATVCAIQVIA